MSQIGCPEDAILDDIRDEAPTRHLYYTSGVSRLPCRDRMSRGTLRQSADGIQGRSEGSHGGSGRGLS